MYIVDRMLPFVATDTKWSDEHQTWYANDDVLDKLGHSTIFAPYYEVHSSKICWKCEYKTPVLTLGVSKIFHHNIAYGVQHTHPDNVLICYEMTQLPDDILAHFCKFECFGRIFTQKIGPHWGNKCIKCSSVQGDYFLGFNNNLYGGPFNSISAAEDRTVTEVNTLTGQKIVCLAVAIDDAFKRPELNKVI